MLQNASLDHQMKEVLKHSMNELVGFLSHTSSLETRKVLDSYWNLRCPSVKMSLFSGQKSSFLFHWRRLSFLEWKNSDIVFEKNLLAFEKCLKCHHCYFFFWKIVISGEDRVLLMEHPSLDLEERKTFFLSYSTKILIEFSLIHFVNGNEEKFW